MRWPALPPVERGDDYRTFKENTEETTPQAFQRYFPELAQLVACRELAAFGGTSAGVTFRAVTGGF
ncbi:MAG: hypothetical protein ACI89J_004475 [Hyphomicrobiaceae bacterium]